VTTASRALDPHSDHPVSAITRARVAAAAGRLGYRPNPMARALRRRRVATIAIVVHDIADPYFAEIVRGATAAASARGFLTVVCSSDRDPLTELSYAEMLRENRVSGVLFAGGGLDEPRYRRRVGAWAKDVEHYGGAVVALAPRPEPWAAELPDNRLGAELATRHLLAIGHRSIAMISGAANLFAMRERESGYVTAMREAGSAELIVRADLTFAGGAAAMVGLMDGRAPTAVFAASDTMALGALSELVRRGIDVPGQLSIAGFGDIPGLEFIHPRLTTVSAHMAELGAAGVVRLLLRLDGEDRTARVNVHPVELVVRDSTGPPRVSGR
jgi:LacI family transcriptional regulator